MKVQVTVSSETGEVVVATCPWCSTLTSTSRRKVVCVHCGATFDPSKPPRVVRTSRPVTQLVEYCRAHSLKTVAVIPSGAVS